MIFTTNQLDASVYPELSKDDLKLRIAQDVEKTQSGSILVPLPEVIALRHDQFDLLMDDPDMQNMYQSIDKIWITPLNAMEVRVKGVTL